MLADLLPPLTGFPIAAICFLVAVEILSILKPGWVWLANTRLLAASLGLIATLLTFLSGFPAADAAKVSDEVGLLVDNHQSLGKALLINFIMLNAIYWVYAYADKNKRLFNLLGRMFLGTALILTVIAGSKGGDLVFKYGIGNKSNAAPPNLKQAPKQ